MKSFYRIFSIALRICCSRSMFEFVVLLFQFQPLLEVWDAMLGFLGTEMIISALFLPHFLHRCLDSNKWFLLFIILFSWRRRSHSPSPWQKMDRIKWRMKKKKSWLPAFLLHFCTSKQCRSMEKWVPLYPPLLVIQTLLQ